MTRVYTQTAPVVVGAQRLQPLHEALTTFFGSPRKVGLAAHFFFGLNMPAATKETVEERARQVAEPLISAEGLELIDVEYKREHAGWILRLFIDKDGGIGIEDCTRATHA